VAAVLLSEAVAAGGDPIGVDVPGNIRVRVVTTETVYKVREPVELQVEVHYTGKVPFTQALEAEGEFFRVRVEPLGPTTPTLGRLERSYIAWESEPGRCSDLLPSLHRFYLFIPEGMT
jgi:hypothetical protein